MREETNQRWLRWCLAGIVVLLAMIAVQLSTLLGPHTPQAHALLPDSGLQRNKMLEEQAKTNAALERLLKEMQKLSEGQAAAGQNLERLLQHLRTQSIKVTMVGTDKETKSAVKPAPRPTPQTPQK